MKRLLLISFAAFLFAPVFGCSGDDYQNEKCCFDQDFSSPVAAVSVDRGNEPLTMATAYLINEREGYFITADHFIDAPRLLQTNEFNLFVNGKAYKASPVRVFQLYDLAVVRIKGDFDTDDLSEPFELVRDSVAVGDTVYARGIHPHPAFLRKKNEEESRAGRVLHIMRDYYGKDFTADSLRTEFVYDNLKAVVTSVDEKMKINYGSSGAVTPRLQRARYRSNSYFYVDIGYNHTISFGGLSGGPVVNKDNKLIGIITAEKPKLRSQGSNIERVYDRITVTYIDLVRDEISRYFEY